MSSPRPIPDDEALPHLAAVASEGGEVRAVLAAGLDPGWTLRRFRIAEARYYPRLNCLLTYRLQCTHASGKSAVLDVYACAYQPAALPDAFRQRGPIATPIGRIPGVVPEWALVLWLFPDDPSIPGLAPVWGEGGGVFDRPGVLVTTPWRNGRPELETSVVSYVPSKRCILRYTAANDGLLPIYGKVYAVDDARVVYEQMAALWRHAAEPGSALHVAQPLGFDAERRAVWQLSPGGASWLEVFDAHEMSHVLARAAAALAAIHRAPLRPSRTWKLSEDVEKLERARWALSRFYPELQPDVERVVRALITSAPAETAHPVFLHGDFHCNQVLVSDDRVAVIDFDLCGVGDPLHDVGRFVSRFASFAAGHLSDAASADAQATFIAAYERASEIAVDRKRLAWIRATALVDHQLLKPVKRLSTGKASTVAALLPAVEELLVESLGESGC